MKNYKYLLLAIVLCFSVFFPNLSCKKDAPEEAIATFIMGNVKLLRQNEIPRRIKHGDKLTSDDIIKTGRNSLFAFEIGKSAIIQISANTTVLMASLLKDKTNRLFLNQGRIILSVKKLEKASIYEVKTPTAIAAVRGTEFSVNYDKDKSQSVVAVNDGTVNVQRMDGKGAIADETIVEEGNAAEVTNTASSIRPVNKEETEEFAKAEMMTILEDVNEKSESDIEKTEQRGVHRKASDNDQKEKQVKASDENSISQDNIAKTDDDATIWTSKKAYKTNDPVIINYKNMPDSRYCWISVAKAGSTGGDYIQYNWTYGKTDGQLVFEELGLEPGNYEVRAHFNRSKNISKRFYFKVE